MISVTPALKAAFNPNDGEGGRFIDWSTGFRVVQADAYAELVPSAVQDTAISRIAQTKNGNADALNLATYELNGFKLDGSAIVPPKPTESPDAEVGLYMNDLSDADGGFATLQVFTATTTTKFNLIAVTLCWGHSPAIDFVVDWYTDGTKVQSVSVTGNMDAVSVVSTAVSNVNKVIVTVTKGRPYRRVRLAEFIPGAILTYDRKNSDTINIDEACDPLNERVVAGTMKLVTDNFAGQFDIFDPTGVYQYFYDRMPFDERIGALQEDGQYGYVGMCTHYLKAPKLKGNLKKLELEAVNILGVLQDTVYSKGTFRTGTLASFADLIAADAGVTIAYPASFNTITVSAYFETMSHAQAFRLLAQATNTLLIVRRDNTIEFLEPGTVSLQTIGQDDYRMENGILPSDGDIINTVDMPYASISQESTTTELAKIPATGTIQSSVFYADNAVITTTAGVYNPKYSPSTGQTASISGGNLIVRGYALTNNRSVLSVTTRQASEQAYVYEPGDNLFVQAGNVSAVANYLLRLKAQKRRKVKIEYRGYPYLEMGDIMSFNTGGVDTQPFILSKNSLKLGGGMTGTLEAAER